MLILSITNRQKSARLTGSTYTRTEYISCQPGVAWNPGAGANAPPLPGTGGCQIWTSTWAWTALIPEKSPLFTSGRPFTISLLSPAIGDFPYPACSRRCTAYGQFQVQVQVDARAREVDEVGFRPSCLARIFCSPQMAESGQADAGRRSFPKHLSAEAEELGGPAAGACLVAACVFDEPG